MDFKIQNQLNQIYFQILESILKQPKICIFCMSQYLISKNFLFPKFYTFQVFQRYLEKEKKMSAATSMAVLSELIVLCSCHTRCHVVNNE